MNVALDPLDWVKVDDPLGDERASAGKAEWVIMCRTGNKDR